MFTCAEFFAGGGMARLGLGPAWRCVLANDNSHNKAYSYVVNHGREHFHFCNAAQLKPTDIPGTIDLGWSSSPCQDLSLAGSRTGLSGEKSKAFWDWWALTEKLVADNRAPRMNVLENVPGLASSHGGRDLATARQAIKDQDYDIALMKIDARHWVPQSRLRLFLVAVHRSLGANLAGYVAKAMDALP